MRRILVLFFALLPIGSADVLTLRNGAVVTGNWLGADGDKIQFLTDDKSRTYLKSEVLEVTFAPVAVAVPTTPPPVITPLPKAIYGPEPEGVGAVYLKDSSGKFIPLERRNAAYQQSGVGIGYSPNRLYRESWVLEGPRSSVRVKNGEATVFVVRLANGLDPRVFQLYPLEVKKDTRRTKFDPRGKSVPLALMLDVSRVGASSWALTPRAGLANGEYAFSPKNSNDAYCFAVDAQ